ncbi:hypothetical protein RRG08_006132 [Elysia crispata]|uniref:Uncharacterized protein n=1 Tax=Elysia crispata TaxID=231223 RepID=A0AAE1DFB8_9GAST|nr:hypothetical protein RRG08_006132 [Elysia crispata]
MFVSRSGYQANLGRDVLVSWTRPTEPAGHGRVGRMAKNSRSGHPARGQTRILVFSAWRPVESVRYLSNLHPGFIGQLMSEADLSVFCYRLSRGVSKTEQQILSASNKQSREVSSDQQIVIREISNRHRGRHLHTIVTSNMVHVHGMFKRLSESSSERNRAWSRFLPKASKKKTRRWKKLCDVKLYNEWPTVFWSRGYRYLDLTGGLKSLDTAVSFGVFLAVVHSVKEVVRRVRQEKISTDHKNPLVQCSCFQIR